VGVFEEDGEFEAAAFFCGKLAESFSDGGESVCGEDEGVKLRFGGVAIIPGCVFGVIAFLAALVPDAVDADGSEDGKAPDEGFGLGGVVFRGAVPDFYECILHGFLCFLAVVEHAHGDAEKGWSPELIEGIEREAVLLADLVKEKGCVILEVGKSTFGIGKSMEDAGHLAACLRVIRFLQCGWITGEDFFAKTLFSGSSESSAERQSGGTRYQERHSDSR
jgi:hypothetical protein